jgi:aryl-alcohol dehydrogenase-like predicted oxidoreductase
MTDLPSSPLPASLPASRLGLGAMGMSGMYGASSDEESAATLLAALDAGVTFIDTGDFYGSGHNEMLIGNALRSRPRSSYQLSVKFGALRGPDGGWVGFDARPAAVRNFLTYSLRRLGTDYIDVYRPARLDPNVPIEETIGEIASLVSEGYVRSIGLSEVGPATIQRAAAVHPIVDVQMEYSLLSRGLEASILPICRSLGISVTAYGVLSRGLISDTLPSTFDPSDFRAHSPRFQGANLEHNQAVVSVLRSLAADRGVTVAQLAIAWVLAQGDDIKPLVGARRRVRLTEALGALSISLSPAELASIESAVPADAARGERYASAQMASLDSER